MAKLRIRPASECRYDLVSLGEVMLRLDPDVCENAYACHR